MREWAAATIKKEPGLVGEALVLYATCPFCGAECAVEWVDWQEWEGGKAPSPFRDPELAAFQSCSHFTGEWDWEGDGFAFAFELAG